MPTFPQSLGTFCFWFALPALLVAQNTDLPYQDRIQSETIASVKFHLTGFPLTDPIIDLNANSTLTLGFDDLSGQVRQFTYAIIHCDADWMPSQLTSMEYLEGFMDQPMRDYRFSFKTLIPFTHYQLEIPNRDMRWTKSGNYALVISDGREVVLTRRFMVVEPLSQIQPRLVRPALASLTRTHQEVDFDVVLDERLDIRNPMNEVWATILQNGRWGMAITEIPPFLVRPRELSFDHQGKVVFPAGKEFRFLDTRSLRRRGDNVAAIDRYNDRTEVILFRDEPRADRSYNFFEDINGAYVIETFDQPNPDLAADYAEVFFTLVMPEYTDGEVYLVGEMTDWAAREAFRMVYNPAINAYVARPSLKQGYYNYSYAVVDPGRPTASPDLAPIEGNWFATENRYTILLYYRPFGSRFDRLIGARSFNSTPR